jgi:hypothetical protein
MAATAPVIPETVREECIIRPRIERFEMRASMTHSGLSKTQAEALAVFLLGKEMRARYAGCDSYDVAEDVVAEDDEPAVRIPGAMFRVLLDHGYLERAAPVRAMLRWRISSAGRAALSHYPK